MPFHNWAAESPDDPQLPPLQWQLLRNQQNGVMHPKLGNQFSSMRQKLLTNYLLSTGKCIHKYITFHAAFQTLVKPFQLNPCINSSMQPAHVNMGQRLSCIQRSTLSTVLFPWRRNPFPYTNKNSNTQSSILIYNSHNSMRLLTAE